MVGRQGEGRNPPDRPPHLPAVTHVPRAPNVCGRTMTHGQLNEALRTARSVSALLHPYTVCGQ